MGFPSVLSEAQRYAAARINSGDIVIDATAGNGVDTLFLARTAGAGGLVYAFDIQAEAIEHTRNRLAAAANNRSGDAPSANDPPGKNRRARDPDKSDLAPVTLLHDSHEHMAERIDPAHRGRIAAVMFNLGYLPGADQTLVTQTATTLAALEAALALLRIGGVLTIVVYPGHEGGDREAEAVEQWAANVPSSLAQSVLYRFPQKTSAPYLLALVKKTDTPHNADNELF